MILLHVSDTHGPIPLSKLPTDFDVLCHTGDWAPEPSWPSDRSMIAPYQMDFFRHEATALAAWLEGRPLVFCLGNHDLLREDWVARELCEGGVTAHAPCENDVTFEGINDYSFLGMRHTPFIHEAFEGGCTPAELETITERTLRNANGWRYVLLAHCPPQGLLSGPNENQWGNPFLTEILRKGRTVAPRLVLCGHIHEDHGDIGLGDTLVVNSACGWSLVDTDQKVVLEIGGRGR